MTKKEKQPEDWDEITIAPEDDEEREVKEEEPAPESAQEEPAQETAAAEQTLTAADAHEETEEDTVLARAKLGPQELYGLELGMSLHQAKLNAENERLRAENEALRQQSINLQRSIGSAVGAGRRSYDAFEEAWYDGN